MSFRLGLLAFAIIFAGRPSHRLQAPPPVLGDSVVLRVYSTGPQQLRVSGAVIADAATSRVLRSSVTPFELRLPTANAHAVFHAIDGGELAGEIVLIHGRKHVPRAAGHGGSVLMMYVGANGEAGFTTVP